jgi:neurotransmitter:Na+ symporter, NSS family
MMATPAEEIYLYKNIIKLYENPRCQVYQEGDASIFSTPLFVSNLICWVVITIILVIGTKAIEIKAIITVPLRFILLLVFVIKFAGLNSSVDGLGQKWYLGGELFPLPDNGSGVKEYRAYDEPNRSLFSDAFGQVFFSLGVCYGSLFAYGSYNKTKKPVIADSIIIALLDFLFSFIAGFGVWGGIGYL